MPDAGCEAAWEDHRRRFLGRDSGDQQFDTGTTMGAPDDGLDREPSSDPAKVSLTQTPSTSVDVAAASAPEPGRGNERRRRPPPLPPPLPQPHPPRVRAAR